MTDAVATRFADAIFDADQSVPEDVTSHTADRPVRRFAIYRANVLVGLANALMSRFPASISAVGEDFFRDMALVFARRHPPRSPVLMTYGDDFPDFVEGFEPAAGVPYLADLMRLEIARSQAYHAADVDPATADDLAALDPAGLAAVRVVLHPAVRLTRSVHPVVTIWSMNSGAREPAPIEDWRGEAALVVRPRLDVEVRSLPAGGYAFLAMLGEGGTLGEAAEVAFAEAPTFDIGAAIAGLVSAGVARSFHAS